jgi:1,4-alpha-glucan branching enzyme
MTQTALDPAAAQAIVEGRHGDPFAVLGPHQVGADWVVTAFVPGAERLFVLGAKSAKPVEAQPVPGFDGLFQGVLARKGAYRLKAQGHGTEWEFEDPFRFGPIMGEMDEYLLGEGTHGMWMERNRGALFQAVQIFIEESAA